MRVGIESTLGRHRSIAFAEILQKRLEVFTHVELCHMEEWRWIPGRGAPRMESWQRQHGALLLTLTANG